MFGWTAVVLLVQNAGKIPMENSEEFFNKYLLDFIDLYLRGCFGVTMDEMT